jgi:hypothetical protein
VVIARAGTRAVSAGVFFHDGKKAVFKFGASDDRYGHVRGSNLVMWQAIRWLAENGFAELDFGRTSLENEGLRRFKLGWDSSESFSAYYKYDFRRARFIADRDHASGWHARAFSVLPNPLARWIGALVYRRLA